MCVSLRVCVCVLLTVLLMKPGCVLPCSLAALAQHAVKKSGETVGGGQSELNTHTLVQLLIYKDLFPCFLTTFTASLEFPLQLSDD